MEKVSNLASLFSPNSFPTDCSWPNHTGSQKGEDSPDVLYRGHYRAKGRTRKSVNGSGERGGK